MAPLDFQTALSQLSAPLLEGCQQQREQVHQWCLQLAALGYGRLGLPPEMGGNPEELLRLVRALVVFSPSLFVKFGVHVGLVQGTIARLGSEVHRSWLERTWSFEQLGCFAMTETDHGSNVRALETRAEYDSEKQEFVLVTPHPGARKDYIGSALSAHFAIVFAQLGEHGVHPFLVPLRDSQGRLLPSIEVEDCGLKAGLNGVDNGRLTFHGVRIPRQNLLDRYGSVSAAGVYSSPIAHPTRRFFTMVGNLVDGRLSLTAASFELSRLALRIALHYASRRRQFGPEDQGEVLLLDHQMHQLRLLPRVALTLALERGVELFRQLYQRQDPGREPLAAALKTYSTWSLQETLRLCRECCGGWGYLAENRLGPLRADCDVFTTFEGDNTVLCFLVARHLLKQRKGCAQWLQLLPWPGRAGSDLVELTGWKAALRFRERRLLSSLARRLRHRLRQGKDPFLALGDCQQHALALTRAHVERLLVEAAPDEDRWGQLYALGCLVEDRAWFLEQGYFSGRQSRALRSLYLGFCQDPWFRQQALLQMPL